MNQIAGMSVSIYHKHYRMLRACRYIRKNYGVELANKYREHCKERQDKGIRTQNVGYFIKNYSTSVIK